CPATRVGMEEAGAGANGNVLGGGRARTPRPHRSPPGQEVAGGAPRAEAGRRRPPVHSLERRLPGLNRSAPARTPRPAPRPPAPAPACPGPEPSPTRPPATARPP